MQQIQTSFSVERRRKVMSIEEKLKEVLIEILDVEEKDITPNTHLITDLGASSVDLVEIVAGIENEFDIDIPDKDAQKIRTVQALIDYVKESAS
jgi:acyl carrier protein